MNSIKSKLTLDFLTVIILIIVLIITNICTEAKNVLGISVENNLKEDNRNITTTRNVKSDTWLMYHHDASLTGFSNSKAPNTNKTIWTFQLDAGIELPPIITKDKVFVVSHYVPFLNGTNLYALNETNGKILWKFVDQGGNIYSSPAFDNGRVFVAPDYHGVYALDEKTGDIFWNFNGRDFEYFDSSYSPTIYDGDVFISLIAKYDWDDASYPATYRIDGESGEVLWKFDNGRGIPTVAGDKVFFISYETDSQSGHYQINCVNKNGNNDGTILDYPTTDLIWTFNEFKQSPYIQPTNPVIVNNKVIFGCKDGYVYVLNTNNGSLIWKYNTTKPIYRSTPAIYNNRVYIGTQTGDSDYGDIYCLDFASSAFVWKRKFFGDIESSIAIADDKLFFGTLTGKIYAIDASSGSIIWQYEIGEFGASTPAVANGKVFVNSMDTSLLYCFSELTNNPPKINEITANPIEIYTGETSIITVNAKDEDNDVLIYYYNTSGGTFSGKGATVNWTAPDIEGIYKITATVYDGYIISNSMSVDIIVKENHAPVINNISAEPMIVNIGDTSFIIVEAFDEDNDELIYIYNVTGGIILGTGATVIWQAPDQEGNSKIIIIVSDGKLKSDEKSIIISIKKLDFDDDGYNDDNDAFPYDPTQWNDTDEDGYGDNILGNNPDNFPHDPTEWNDTDGDRIGDNSDPFPNDSSQWLDNDSDGCGDNISGNNPDMFPNDPTEWNDTDNDGVGDNSDAFPIDPAASIDLDGDAYPDYWNEGYNKDDSTTGLQLDDYPEDIYRWKKEDDKKKVSEVNLILIFEITCVLIIIGITCVILYKKYK